jgi:hypothetical protein
MDHGSYTPRPRYDPRRRQRQLARRRLLVLVAFVLVVAAIIAVVVVSRGKSGEKTGDKTGGTEPKPGKTVAASASPSPKPTPQPPKVWVASKSDPVRVWVGGDSMAGELGWSLGPLLEKTKVFKPILYYKTSSGICRWDFFDWGRQMETVMRTARPNAVVMMMGTNDTQSVWDDGTWIAYGTTKWKTLYEKRVSDMMRTMLDGGARRVYWVGMPMMAESWRNPRMKVINKIIAKAAAENPGAEYVDAWALFVDANGDYVPGLRLADGVHFTPEGQQRLAKAVLKDIEKDWLPDGLPSPSPSPSASPSASASPSV